MDLCFGTGLDPELGSGFQIWFGLGSGYDLDPRWIRIPVIIRIQTVVRLDTVLEFGLDLDP